MWLLLGLAPIFFHEKKLDLNVGTEVIILKQVNEFYKVKFNDVTGWVNKDDLEELS